MKNFFKGVPPISNLYAAEEYKNEIINLLCQSQNFIKLINPTSDLYKYVFDYDFTDDALAEEKTFVFVDTNIDTIRDNMFTDFTLCVYVFTNKNLVRLNSSSVPTPKEVKDMGYFSADTRGNRIGALCECIDRILNGSNLLWGIGDLRPAAENHLSAYAPNTNYYGKCLKYTITNYNSGGDEFGN